MKTFSVFLSGIFEPKYMRKNVRNVHILSKPGSRTVVFSGKLKSCSKVQILHRRGSLCSVFVCKSTFPFYFFGNSIFLPYIWTQTHYFLESWMWRWPDSVFSECLTRPALASFHFRVFSAHLDQRSLGCNFSASQQIWTLPACVLGFNM